MPCRQDKGKAVTVHAEHGLMFEDARQHQRAAYYYKQAILLGCQTANADLDYSVDSVLVGIAEAYDGEWQDTGTFLSAGLSGQQHLRALLQEWQIWVHHKCDGAPPPIRRNALHFVAKYTGCP